MLQHNISFVGGGASGGGVSGGAGEWGGRVEGVAAVLLSSVHLYIFPRNSFFLITGHKMTPRTGSSVLQQLNMNDM